VSKSYHPPAFNILSYDCIIWDFDGTLFDHQVNWEELKGRVHNFLQSYRGYAPPQSCSLGDIESEARRLHAIEPVFEIITEVELAGLGDWERGLRQVPSDIFLHLSSRSIVVSNNMSGTLVSFLDRLGIAGVPFSSRDRVTQPKPAPEGALELRAHWEGKKTVLIGDSEIDKELAKACGIEFMLVQNLVQAYPKGIGTTVSRGNS